MVLDKGNIIEKGNHRELLARGGLYTRLYEMTYLGTTSKMN
jgi:ABC-type multidrug transport system fused ATPase/permease subunit